MGKFLTQFSFIFWRGGLPAPNKFWHTLLPYTLLRVKFRPLPIYTALYFSCNRFMVLFLMWGFPPKSDGIKTLGFFKPSESPPRPQISDVGLVWATRGKIKTAKNKILPIVMPLECSHSNSIFKNTGFHQQNWRPVPYKQFKFTKV